jgi:tripartite-type tricarboxylate transporter receptor subunit TctC
MPPVSRRSLIAALPAAAAAAAPAAATAQGSAPAPPWPERPVRVVVPFAAGSTPDLAARAVAGHFAQVFGQPFVAENRAGAGGAIGTEAVAKATDGHTLGVSIGGPASTAKVVNPGLGYDPATDLVPVSLLVRLPLVFAVHPSVPARTLAEFVAYAKANPGRLNYGSVGAGTLGHLMTAEFAARHGLEMTHVPFRSVPQGVTELVAGRIQCMAAVTGAVLGQVREGNARALAISSEGRFAAAPEIPTLTEQGEGAAIWTWIGLFAPPGTPAPRVARLAEEARRALSAPEAARAMTAAGFEVVASPPEAFRGFVAEEIARWTPLIRRLDIRPES